MSRHHVRGAALCASAAFIALASGGACAAQTAASPEAATVEELVVVGRDKVGLIETTPSSTLFGVEKPLVETPRSATFVSEVTLKRYGVEEVDDLISISPGAFTSSFYGVKGAVNLRGTLAETYYRGFKRIENRGTYQTPLSAAAQVEILRGPPTSVFGPGKVGGFLNITPKTARNARGVLADTASGQAEVTVGAYGKFNADAEVTLPVRLGSVAGGLYGYVEREDSDSFYRGIHPKHTLVQVAGDFDLSERWALETGAMVYDADGYVQTPGWNRLTQDLIDNGNYITGRDTTIVDANGDGRLTPAEIGKSLVAGYFGTTPAATARFTLDTGVGVAKLDRRTVFVSDADFSTTRTNTFYAGLTRKLGESADLKLQAFYDDLENKRAVSYGFPAWYDTRVWELRATSDFGFDIAAMDLVSRYEAGLSWRDYKGVRKESFNSGYLAIDRRDLTYGATGGDTFADPFHYPELGWDNDIHSDWTDGGVFLLGDLTFAKRVNLMFGARYDWYDLNSRDLGKSTGSSINSAATDGGQFTWNASLSYKTPWGLIPYVTYAKGSALEGSQAGDVAPSLISKGQWLSDSDLKEAGVKFDMFGRTLVGGLSVYSQNRTRLTSTNSVVATTGKGVELELRWLVNDNVSFTFAGNRQKTVIEGPDASFIYIPAYVTGLSGAQVYGGTYAVYNFATSTVGFKGDYELRSIPRSTASLYGSYVSDPLSWGQYGATVGVIRVSSTATKLADPVVFPAYTLVNASAFVTFGRNQLTANLNNVFDQDYFQPVADTYVNMAALPGRGREWRLTYTRAF